jgi:ribonuclease PH
MMREDGRRAQDLRDIRITKSFMKNAHGSALIEWGNTRVLCTAMYTPGVPAFLEGTERGWLTAEYAMLPASTPQRKQREIRFPDGRSTEISRLIGRALRSVFDLKAAAGYTINIDCDVIDADGGTRTAAITGAYIALELCIRKMTGEGLIGNSPLKSGVAAVSCGITGGAPVCDLNYFEDSRAEADMNVVMSHGGGIIEIQCTGEKRPLSRKEFDALLRLAGEAIEKITAIQKDVLERGV